mmetsp:Transcript_38535/g.91114  ORF Transcript_38535/g.91114 Transcript_38535/m.91114 type:complete len:201 (+) Transcript_38535:79-681(+)
MLMTAGVGSTGSVRRLAGSNSASRVSGSRAREDARESGPPQDPARAQRAAGEPRRGGARLRRCPALLVRAAQGHRAHRRGLASLTARQSSRHRPNRPLPRNPPSPQSPPSPECVPSSAHLPHPSPHHPGSAPSGRRSARRRPPGLDCPAARRWRDSQARAPARGRRGASPSWPQSAAATPPCGSPRWRGLNELLGGYRRV